jgi:hypothetical protein
MENMYIHTTEWNTKPSFRMMPVTEDCPFNEAVYDPENKHLAVISKNKRTQPMFVPKVDNLGQDVGDKLERKDMQVYYEYCIETKDEIEDFIRLFAINPNHPIIAII